LEDLLARGTPADLKAANELMKVMAGYVTLITSKSPYIFVNARIQMSTVLLMA